jgi:4'-phosphopantetheinyl transferase
MPAVGVGEIHLWCFRLDEPRDALADALSADELARAARLRRPVDRHRFAVAHATRREILSRYVGVAPADLRFEAGDRGKPQLAGPAGGLQFNVAASGGLALLGVRADGEVGVDLELVRLQFDWRPLAASFFTWAENRALASLASDAGRAAFFRCWTRKEAYVKARGEGLSRPLDGFELAVERAPAVERMAGWWIRELDAAPGYAAAVAGDGEPPAVSLRRWER